VKRKGNGKGRGSSLRPWTFVIAYLHSRFSAEWDEVDGEVADVVFVDAVELSVTKPCDDDDRGRIVVVVAFELEIRPLLS